MINVLKKSKSGDQRKRQFELGLVFIATLVLVILSRVQARLYDLSEQLSQNQEFFTSIIFFGMININSILVLFLGFLVFRNLIKLVLERRRGILGSRLKTKLVATLLFFALAPTCLIYYVSTHFLNSKFEEWFSEKVRHTIQQTHDAGALIYKQDQKRIEGLARLAGEFVIAEESENFFRPYSLKVNSKMMHDFAKNYSIENLLVIDIDGEVKFSSGKKDFWDPVNFFPFSQFLNHEISRGFGRVVNLGDKDVVQGFSPIIDKYSGQFVGMVMAEEHFETQVMKSLDSLMNEFANLKPGVKFIQLTFSMVLFVMLILIAFSATWLGFHVAKEISTPLIALSNATSEIAHGRYKLLPDSKKDDEAGVLIRAFNHMTRELEVRQSEIERQKNQLEMANIELEGRRKNMEVILQHVSAGVIALDKQHYITAVNQAAEKLLQVDAQKILGRTYQKVFNPEIVEDFFKKIFESLESRSQSRLEIEMKSLNLKSSVTATRLFDEDGRELGVVVVFADMAEELKIQRVAAWKEVAERIAHEIKNPLTPIALSSQRLLRRFADKFHGEERDIFSNCIETILSQVDSLKNLVNEFSKFARLPSVVARPEDIRKIILETLELYKLSYPDIIFKMNLAADIPSISLDKEQMKRVFVNVITNCLHALNGLPNKSEKIVSIKAFILEKMHTLRIEVTDNGSGIPKELKNRVFEPYFSTKPEGTGLGLAIVNQIISDHGGYVRIVDSLERSIGTTVIIELPFRDGMT